MDTLETRGTISAARSTNPADSDGQAEAACCVPAPQPTLNHAQRLAALADRLKAVADPTRLRMLELLARQSSALCVCEITDQFTLHQPTISHHLRLLREAGLIAGEKRGTWSYYWATDEGKRVLAQVESLA